MLLIIPLKMRQPPEGQIRYLDRLIQDTDGADRTVSPLPVAEVHQPTQREHREHERSKAIQSVAQAVLVVLLGHDSEHDRREQCEKNGRLKVRQAHFRH